LITDTTNYSGVTTGIAALTAATGTDVAQGSISGTVTGETFVAYRTQVSVKHAATQPNFQDPSTASQEVYRFTTTADAARQAEIGRVTFDVALSGMQTTATPTFVVRQVKNDGTIDNTATVTSSVTTDISGAAKTSGRVVVNFSNQKLAAGESRTFALFMNNTVTSSAVADDDAVSVTIVSDTAYAAPAAKSGVTIADTGTLTVVLANDPTAAADGSITIDGNTYSTVATDTLTTIEAALVALSGTGTNGVVITNGASTTDGIVLLSDPTGTTVASTATLGTDITSVTTVSDGNGVTNANTKVLWSDESSNAHSDSTLDWLNGYLLEVDTTSKVNAD
jgi:hypothetical protein